MNGYIGKIFRVDLSSGKSITEDMNAEIARDFIGGTGVGVRLAYDMISPDCDPLGPDNKLIFATGPLTATRFPTAARYQLVYKSPLTGILCDSSAGGFWGVDLKKSGCDVLIIEGKSDKPVYLWINDGVVEICDAAHLMGKDCFETQSIIKDETGDPKTRVGCIGVAGERGSLHACFINDEGRTLGRGGHGAVFGSKNLKAIAVRGTMSFPLADEEKFNAECSKLGKDDGYPKNPGFEPYAKFGTAAWMKAARQMGDVPVKNWQIGDWEQGCLNLCGQKMAETILTKRSACYRCPLACGRMVKIEKGPYAFEGPGPEYETLAALGSNTMIDDLDAVAYAGHLCDIYGIDTMSTGATIAWAMECFEKGLLTTEDTDGIELKFGDPKALIAAVEKAGKVEGSLGKLIAIGMKRASEKVKSGSEDFACQVKGLETAMHDPRAFPSMAVTYATGPRGACHLHGQSMILEGEDSLPEWGLKEFDPEEKTKGMAKISDAARSLFELYNSMVVCAFFPGGIPLNPSDFANFLNLATGNDYTSEKLQKTAERIATLHRAYNNRCGITRKDDKLSKRQLMKLKDGGSKDYSPDLPTMLDEYYQIAGWDKQGKPTAERLKSLGLDFVINDIHG